MPRSPNKGLFTPEEEPDSNIPRGKNYLLVIGIDEYQNDIKPLYNAVHDAKAFRDVLWENYQFDKKHTFELYNQDATRSAIIRTFYDLIEQLSNEDNLVFYFSGHGELHPTTKRGFWIPVDAINADTGTYLNNLEVIDFIDNFKARHVFGIVDSCFSAALFAQRSLDNASKRQYSIPSRWLLTAGRLERVSDGFQGKHSPFAESLLQQLRYYEGPNLWVSSLCQKVIQGVTYNAKKQMPRGEPLQNTGHQGGEFIFLRKAPAPRKITGILKENAVALDAPIDDRNQSHILGKSWFLGIGIDEYHEMKTFRKLYHAVKDVVDIGKLLYEQYLVDEVEFLLNEKASKSAIINTLHRLAKELTEKDILLIYFSGYGPIKEFDWMHSSTLWVPVDARPDDPSSVISNDTIIEYLRIILARHIFLVSDSCYSGSFLGSRSVYEKEADLSYTKRLEHNKSRWGLFSAKDNQVAGDRDSGENSPFAAAILTVLSQNKNSYINAGLFANEVVKQTKRNAPDQNAIYSPIIGCGDNNGQYIFWLREQLNPMPMILFEENKEKSKIKNLPFPYFPTDRRLANNIPSVCKKTLIAMEKSLRQNFEIMLRVLCIPIQADRWALRDFCTGKAHSTIDILNEIQGLKEELDEFSLSSGPLFNRVVNIQKKFTQHLSLEQFQFTDTETSTELSQFIKSPLFKTDAKLQENKRILQRAFQDNLEQKNILRDNLIDTSMQLQLLYLTLEKIVYVTDQNEPQSSLLN